MYGSATRPGTGPASDAPMHISEQCPVRSLACATMKPALAFLLVLAACGKTATEAAPAPVASIVPVPATPPAPSVVEAPKPAPFVITLNIVEGKNPERAAFRAKLVVTTSDGQRFTYREPVYHLEFYETKPEHGELASWHTGGSGGYGEEVTITRTSPTELRIRMFGSASGVDIPYKPENIQEETVKVPAGAVVSVVSNPWKG